MKLKKINFEELFLKLQNKNYTIIKLDPKFPDYIEGQDLDILCYDINDISNVIVSFLSDYVDDNFKIFVLKYKNKTHVDLINNKKIHFRFDIIDKFPQYKKIEIKNSYFDVVIENSKFKHINNIKIKTPDYYDEFMLRYFEYIEYYSSVPDKIKHVDYINSHLRGDSQEKKFFFDRLYHFSSLPQKYHYKKQNINLKLLNLIEYFFDLIKKSFLVIKNDGLFVFFKKVFNFLKN
jgi:hypothetical protein